MIVLDASVWIDVLARRRSTTVVAGQALHVPPHFDAEVIGGLRSMCQRGLLDEPTARTALERHLAVPFHREHDAADIRSAWALRDVLSFADGWYAALAQRLDAPWVTGDHRAGRTADTRGLPVRLV